MAEFEKRGDVYNKIMVSALADRLAEAFAEKIHKDMRTTYWGFAPEEDLPLSAFFDLTEVARGDR